MTVSGILDSAVSFNAGAKDAPEFSFGLEEYANIRFQSRIRDKAVIYGAVNLIAVAGSYAAGAVQTSEQMILSGYTHAGINLTPYTDGRNFIAGIELERLYFRLRGEHTDFDGGLMRLPFGYGQVCGPSDFLNPRNPLKPDARARAILGAALSWYPADELKLLVFYSAPRDPFSQEAKGSFAGLSLDQHWEKASLQALYSFETPADGYEFGVHRAGLSAKADLEIGIVMDALYTYNHDDNDSLLDGLSFSIGADYSFFDGKLLAIAEYLFNGGTSSTALFYGGSFSNNHYLYAGLTYSFNDFTNMNAAVMCGFDDVSFTPIISVNHDLFQGATLTITAQVPLDRDLFYNDGNRGELGPLNARSYFSCNARIRLRF